MSKTAQNFIAKYGEWIYRGIMIFGFVLILFLNQNYVTKAEFRSYTEQNDKDRKEFNTRLENKLSDLNDKIISVKETMNQLSIRIDLDDSKNKLNDHETRLRQLESKKN